MFAGPSRADAVLSMAVREAADRDDVQLGIREHLIQVIIEPDWRAEFCLQLRRVEPPGRANSGHLPQGSGVDCCDVCRCSPTVADDADVEFFHEQLPNLGCLLAMPVVYQALVDCEIQNCSEPGF